MAMSEPRECYLDHAASTPMRPEATEAWLEAAAGHHANPTGAHRAARHARRALDDARDVVAAVLDRSPAELVFTSGGSEADNLAVRGVLGAVGGVAYCSGVSTMRSSNPSSTPAAERLGCNPTGPSVPTVWGPNSRRPGQLETMCAWCR